MVEVIARERLAMPYLIKARPEIENPSLMRPDWTAPQGREGAILRLDKNENVDPILAFHLKEIINELDPSLIGTYPDCSNLYRKLASYLSVAPTQLILSAGSDGVIRSVFDAFISPGDKVLLPAPTFAMYSIYCQIFGAISVHMIYDVEPNGNPFVSIDTIKSFIASSGAKLMCLPNPDSPTGSVLLPNQLEELIQLACDNHMMVLIDEAYFPFYPHSCINLVSKFPNLIIARTFAKAWGLAGMRIGFGISNGENTALLQKVKPMYEVNSLSVAVVEKLLENPSLIEDSVKRLLDGKIYFENSMSNLGFKVLISHGNFSHVKFGNAVDRIHAALANKVLYRKDFQEQCLKGYSRFSSANKELVEGIVQIISHEARQND
jgi:histidinol-phosphate aminotransferase